MARMTVVPVGKGASAVVPDDLGGRTRALLVVGVEDGSGIEGTTAGDVVLLGEGEEYGMYGCGQGRFELTNGAGRGEPVARGNILGVLKKFNG